MASAWQYGYGTLDPSAKRVQEFHPFPQFVNQHWGGATIPDPTLGWVHLTANGGHPGQDEKHCAIRRWVSPIAGEIEIHGTLGHPSDQGDGVRGWIISSRQGAAQGMVGEARQPRDVHRQPDRATGRDDRLRRRLPEIVKITTDLRGPPSSRRNKSPDRIRVSCNCGTRRMISADRPPPRLNAWEQLAQALLISNEFVFVD